MTQQAIEDTKTGALPEGEEPEASSEESVRSQPWEEHELRQLIREETFNLVNPAFNTLKGQIQSLQTVLPQIEEVVGGQANLKAMVQRVLKGTMTDEDYQALEQADQLAIERRRAEKAEAGKKALEEAQTTQDGGKAVAWHHILADVEEHTEKEGVPSDVALTLQPKALGTPSPRDPFGFLAHKREWVKAISEYSDKQSKEQEPKPAPVTERGGAVPTGQAYYKALKEGKALPSAEEIDRLTAKFRPG